MGVMNKNLLDYSHGYFDWIEQVRDVHKFFIHKKYTLKPWGFMLDEHRNQNKLPTKEQNRYLVSCLLHTYMQKTIKRLGTW
jgi:hypothetical protein